MTELGAQISSGAALLGAGVAGLFAYSVLAPRSQLFFPVISRGDDSDPARIALTFDDGPWPEGTVPILDTLKSLKVRAAFFVIGANAQRYPDLVRRMDAEGHIVGNHTFDHRHLGAMRSRRYWRDQLERTDVVLTEILGRRPALFRPPLGLKSWMMAGPLRQSGHVTVCWSRRGLDGVRTTTDKILSRMSPAKPGEILVLHDGQEPWKPRDPAPTVAAIEPLVQTLRDRGLEFERLDRFIGVEAYLPAPTELGSTALAEAAGA
jgi:peptidoglycan/xylan/chitin deacetylase (PgdA/CDA1 family)